MKTASLETQVSRDLSPRGPSSGDVIPEGCGIIRMHLREVGHLFDSLDPSPLDERDIDPKSEEYIVESIREISGRKPCAVIFHLDQPAGLSGEGVAVGQAIRLYFGRRSQLLRRKLRVLIRRGLVSLGIGLTFLAAVLVAAESVVRLMGESGLALLLREGLMIVGWVAMWRPLEIFLYDWWPIVGERRIYDRLSRIHVRLEYEGAPP